MRLPGMARAPRRGAIPARWDETGSLACAVARDPRSAIATPPSWAFPCYPLPFVALRFSSFPSKSRRFRALPSFAKRYIAVTDFQN